MEKYKILSDSVFEANGKDLKELFENAAETLFSVIYQLDKVEPKEVEEFEMKGESLEDTMWNWLSGLIAIVDTEQMFFSKFEVEEIDEIHVKAKIFGEGIRPEIVKNPIVSLDSSKYKLEKTNEGYKVTIGLK